MKARRLAAALVVGCAVGAACREPGAFACEDDAACGDGRCEPEGFCSFPDGECGSGQRFGDHAGDGLAGACVSTGGGTGGTATDTDGGGMTSTSAGPGVDSGSESSGLAVSDTGDTTGTVDRCPDWWDCAWPMRVPIEVSWRGPALDGFPVRVALTSERLDFTASTTDGSDVRIVDDGGRTLPFEIEQWDAAASTAELWVRLPSLQDGARIWLYHGNLDAQPASDPAAVFTRDYLAVWHMGPQLSESTGAAPLTDMGSTDAAGRIGRGRGLDGSSAYLRPAPEPSLLDVFEGGATLSAWFSFDTFGQGSYGRIVDHASVTHTIDGWSLSVAGLADGGTMDTVRFAHGYETHQDDWRPAVTLRPGTWYHVAVTYASGVPSTAPQFFIDGAPVEAVQIEVPEGPVNAVAEVEPAIGALATGTQRFFDGTLDEIRVSGLERSADWLAAEHASDVDAILSFQPPEFAPR